VTVIQNNSPAPRTLLTATLVALTALFSVVLTATGHAAVTPATATLESGTFGEFSQTNALNGTLTNTTARAYQGTRSAHATYSGGTANAYSRGIWNIDWQPGEEVWYAAAYYLPVGFKATMQGQIDLLRWDNYGSMPSGTERGGVVIYNSDKRAHLMRQKDGGGQTAIGAEFDLPEGRWFWLEVHQRLSTTNPLSEVYLDGTRVVSTTAQNSYGHRVDRVRFGLVAISAGSQTKPLELFFDSATVAPASSGTTPTPTPTPEPTPTPVPPADTTAPETAISAAPAPFTTSTAANFSFNASETSSTFECSLDGGSWGACASPKSYSGLALGAHSFAVRARDAAGNVDASPATATWTVTIASSTVSGGDKARGRVATASSFIGSNRPANAVDGSSKTSWTAAARDGEWWQVDLGRVRLVDKVEINWNRSYATAYRIDVSADGVNFTTAANVTVTSRGWKLTSIGTRSVRYLRVVAVKRSAATEGASFASFEAYGQAD
jgi:hypothetical protein